MVKLFVASTTRNKMPPEKNLRVGWDSLKFSFHSLTTLLLLIMLSHQAFVLVLSGIIQIFDRAIVISDNLWRTSTLFVPPFWFPRNIASPFTNCLDPSVTEWGGNQRLQSMGINTKTTLDCWICHFCSTLSSKYRWWKNIRIWEKSVYMVKLSGCKSFWIQSSHFKFWIENFWRHDQTRMFSFQIRPLVCKQQNRSAEY